MNKEKFPIGGMGKTVCMFSGLLQESRFRTTMGKTTDLCFFAEKFLQLLLPYLAYPLLFHPTGKSNIGTKKFKAFRQTSATALLQSVYLPLRPILYEGFIDPVGVPNSVSLNLQQALDMLNNEWPPA
jgi:hypothetical protein